MTALDRDIRFSSAALRDRCVYSTLFAARRSIADGLAIGLDPLAIAAGILRTGRDEAASELEQLRAAGLVGDGLTLLAGTRSSRRAAVTTTDATPADVDAVRGALAAHAGSRRALAREIGCSESALRQFANGGRALGPGHLASLTAVLGLRSDGCAVAVRSNECAVDVRTTQPTAQGELRTETAQSTAQPAAHGFSLSDSLSSSPPNCSSSDLSLTKENGSSGDDGGSLREGAQSSARSELRSDVRSNCAVEEVVTAQLPAAATAQPALVIVESKPRRERRPRPAPAADPVPPEGTVARRVYEAITTDVALAPVVRGPGDLAQRLAAICDGTHVDPAAEVISAGAWLTRNPGRWSDGAAGLLRWVKSSADKARSLPAPVIGVPRPSAQPERIDYQGRRAVGAAGLPSGDVWTNDRDEEAEAFERIRARTQPKGATGR